MPKPVELPPEVAQAFATDLKLFHAEKNATKCDGIAARQAWLLQQHYGGKLKLHDVRAMFYELKDYA